MECTSFPLISYANYLNISVFNGRNREFQYLIQIIRLNGIKFSLLVTFKANLDNLPSSRVKKGPGWPHEPLATILPVSRIDVDRFGPQAFWTMIGIAVPFDMMVTILTNKVFNFSLKFSAHIEEMYMAIISNPNNSLYQKKIL